MSNTHPTFQTSNGVGIEHVPNHAVCFNLVESTAGTAGHDSCGILASVLQKRETFTAMGGERAEMAMLLISQGRKPPGER
jgi:hypothetical protein